MKEETRYRVTGSLFHAPAGPPHQRRLCEIVAQDVAAERRATRQLRQMASGGECPNPDHCVVAPVVAARTVPARQTFGVYGAVAGRCELLQPREQRPPAHEAGQRLDQTDARIGGEPPGQRQQRLRRDQAVGVEHHHGLVTSAPTLHPVSDVAGLALDVVRPVAVIERTCCRCIPVQRAEHLLFSHPRIR